jgi:hypothetical protein
MKSYKLIFFLVFSICITANSQLSKDSISIATKIPNHPRLLLLKGEEKELLKNIRKDVYWSEMHASVLREADRIITLPLNDRIFEGRRLLNISRSNLQRIFFLSYAYRMTGEKRYSDRAEAEMLQIASFSDWNPNHYLDVAEMTLAMAIGYDWNFNQLSDQSKTTIKEAIISKGLMSSLKTNNSWLRNSNNWNQVCNTGISMGALAVYEENPALSVQLLNRAIKTLPISMNEYSPDGAYPEGIGYWSYGTTFNTFFLAAMEKIYHTDFGLSAIPGFMKTGIFSQVMVSPRLNPFCHSDVGTKIGFEPAVFWFYSKTKNPALLYNQKKLYESDTNKKYLRDRLFPLALIWGASSEASLSNPAEPKELMWLTQSRIPVAVMRSSWGDKNSIYLGFKGGSPSANHAHMDGGSFYFEANGVRWGLDLGMQSYTQIEAAGVDLWNMTQNSSRWDVYRLNNFVHNTLTINNEKQLVNGSATIESYLEKENFMGLVSDLSSLYSNSVKKALRSVELVDKSYVVVEDKITTGDKLVKLRWNMTTEATKLVEVSKNKLLLTYQGKKLYMLVEGVTNLETYYKPATPSKEYESQNPNVSLMGFEVTLPPNTSQTIRVFLMPEKEIEIKGFKSLLIGIE